MKMDPPMKVFATKSPPLFQSAKDVKAGSKALFKPSASPGWAPMVHHVSYSNEGKEAKNKGLMEPPKSLPSAS
ncbi:MAG: hypothetical protein CMC99_03640 [Flavobacteriales bacterium]|nr:hypothetical protein [Flavobacteriales bacterium]